MSAAETLDPAAATVDTAASDVSESGLLGVVVTPSGDVRSISGRWCGVGRPAVTHLVDFVHPDDHDALLHALAWACDRGPVAHGLPVDVRGPAGWAPAVVAVEAVEDGVRCTFVPVTADPLPAVAADLADGRGVDAVVDRAVRTFAAACPQVWVSVHWGLDGTRRRRRMAGAFGHEGFAGAVRAAAAGSAPTPWDTPIAEEPATVTPPDLPDGVRMAAGHLGLASILAVPVPSLVGDDAAVVMTWCEHPGRLSDPAAAVALDRLAGALRLAFATESLRATVRHAATHDDLTGLWNRSAVLAHLARVDAGAGCAVVCFDIDDFASVNDRRGAHAGDALLVEIADRLRQVVRPGDLLARVDGDDYVMVCPGVTGDEAAAGIAARVMSVTYQPVHLDGVATDVRASIGVAVARPDLSGRDLLDRAARALAEVKSRARGTWTVA